MSEEGADQFSENRTEDVPTCSR